MMLVGYSVALLSMESSGIVNDNKYQNKTERRN